MREPIRPTRAPRPAIGELSCDGTPVGGAPIDGRCLVIADVAPEKGNWTKTVDEYGCPVLIPGPKSCLDPDDQGDEPDAEVDGGDEGGTEDGADQDAGDGGIEAESGSNAEDDAG